MKLSESGKKFIKSHEGFRNTYYDLKDGGLTVGFGNYMTYAAARSKGIKVGDKITDEQADAMFNKSVEGFVAGVNAQIKQYDHDVNQNQFDVLVSYAYNRGLGNSKGTNGLRQLLKNSKSVNAISKNLLVYWGTNTMYKKGLLNRRNAEKKLFDTPIIVKVSAPKPKPVVKPKPVAKPEKVVKAKSKTTQYKVTAGALNIRATASNKGKIIGELAKGNTVQVIKIVGGWAHVKSGSKTVYVGSKYIKKV